MGKSMKSCSNSRFNSCRYSMFIFAIFIIILSFASCSDLNDNPIDIPDGDRYEDIVFDEYTLTRNIKYGSNVSMSGSQIDLKLDLYEPKGDTVEERPLVILAPGGAFQYLSNLDMNNIAEKLTSYGYVCAVISYRILDNSSITEQTYLDVAIKARADLKAAIRFFVKDADGDQKYRINTDNLFVGGYSSGAITALNAVFINSLSEVDANMAAIINNNGGIEGNSGNPGYSANVRGVVNLSGAVFDLDIINNENVAVLNIHGDNDPIIPYDEGDITSGDMSLYVYGSKSIHEKAASIGLDSELFIIQNGSHSAPVIDIDDTTLRIKNFLYDNLSGFSIL